MERTLDMQFMRYLNLFEKITQVRIQHCFSYNSAIIFVVPEGIMARAISEGGRNIKKLSEILGKRVKVIAKPEGRQDLERFILAVVHPVKFKNIEIQQDNLVINAGRQSKAALIGRNKVRLEEMKNILESYFGIKDVRIA